MPSFLNSIDPDHLLTVSGMIGLALFIILAAVAVAVLDEKKRKDDE